MLERKLAKTKNGKFSVDCNMARCGNKTKDGDKELIQIGFVKSLRMKDEIKSILVMNIITVNTPTILYDCMVICWTSKMCLFS